MNVNFMEVFVAGYDVELKKPFAFLFCQPFLCVPPKDINRILRKYPDMDFIERNYKAVGVDQVSIVFF
jgi:hypothetical protein